MEYLNIFDKDGNPLGTMSREKCHKKGVGVFHKHVHIWIVNDSDEVLFQLRSHNKTHHPNKWEVCGGHESAGETGIETCQKEVFEELGIKLDANEIHLIKSMIIGNAITEIYTAKVNSPTTDFVLQKSEVDECFWLPIKDVESFVLAPHFDSLPEDYAKGIVGWLKSFWKLKNIPK